MQLAMTSVNEQNKEEDLPDLEMGSGIHTGQVVVGNIGSLERMKYGVIGSHVNLTSRIQSCTTGGQVLVSWAPRREVCPVLKIGKKMWMRAKGVEPPLTTSPVGGGGVTEPCGERARRADAGIRDRRGDQDRVAVVERE